MDNQKILPDSKELAKIFNYYTRVRKDSSEKINGKTVEYEWYYELKHIDNRGKMTCNFQVKANAVITGKYMSVFAMYEVEPEVKGDEFTADINFIYALVNEKRVRTADFVKIKEGTVSSNSIEGLAQEVAKFFDKILPDFKQKAYDMGKEIAGSEKKESLNSKISSLIEDLKR